MVPLPTAVLLLLAAQVVRSSPSLAEVEASLGTPVYLPAPPGPLMSQAAVDYMQSSWSLWQNKIQTGLQYFSFVTDPYENDGAVLSILYPKGSFGADGGGGAHFYSTALAESEGKQLGSLLLQYEVAFQEGFNFRWGGKLPGLRGGNPNGCGGGLTADGLHCESTRLMWREYGAGEVYAYIPMTADQCAIGPPYVECNDMYGTSLSRGSFYFATGAWTKIALYIQLNSPASASNGVISLYANGELALEHTGLQIRASDKIYEGGMWFSSFFGGGNSSWSSPQTQRSYFKNFQLAGSTEFAFDAVTSSPPPPPPPPLGTTTSSSTAEVTTTIETSTSTTTSSSTTITTSATPPPTSTSTTTRSTTTIRTLFSLVSPLQASAPSSSFYPSSPVRTTTSGALPTLQSLPLFASYLALFSLSAVLAQTVV